MTDNQKDSRNDQFGSGSQSQQQSGGKENQQQGNQQRPGTASGKTGANVEDTDQREDADEEEEENFVKPGTQNPNPRKDQ